MKAAKEIPNTLKAWLDEDAHGEIPLTDDENEDEGVEEGQAEVSSRDGENDRNDASKVPQGESQSQLKENKTPINNVDVKDVKDMRGKMDSPKSPLQRHSSSVASTHKMLTATPISSSASRRSRASQKFDSPISVCATPKLKKR